MVRLSSLIFSKRVNTLSEAGPEGLIEPFKFSDNDAISSAPYRNWQKKIPA